MICEGPLLTMYNNFRVVYEKIVTQGIATLE